ncbi:MAG: hypothetical protein JNN10_12520 [Sphingopyxis sp.]|uniref:DUF5681 domain-containing protein n=1 Tax=Sphingopyxis sp. TaxID=1908224 RepID=UPI001A38D430|nr:DUF5681 domain-containing protein [Sphingopyxis sp.]MBL9067109.1 hypothetical protein [Sphingopyxis sp.]
MTTVYGRDEEPMGLPDYEVGYARPPEKTRFKKGNKSGKGRPKGSPNLKTMVNRIADEKVSAKIQGKPVKLKRKELMLLHVATLACQGDLRALDRFLPLIERFEDAQEAAAIPVEDTREDLAAIKEYFRYHGMSGVGDEA